MHSDRACVKVHVDPPQRHRRDGRPQTSPVSGGVDLQGRIVISTYPARATTRNAERDSRVSVLILSNDWNGPWVQIDGNAEVLHMPEATERA